MQLLPDYLAEAKKLEEKVETFKRLTDMESKVARLEQELQWALVIEIEEVSGKEKSFSFSPLSTLETSN